jgi:hypothetical protein
MTAAQYKRVQVRNERRPGRDMETSWKILLSMLTREKKCKQSGNVKERGRPWCEERIKCWFLCVAWQEAGQERTEVSTGDTCQEYLPKCSCNCNWERQLDQYIKHTRWNRKSFLRLENSHADDYCVCN